MQTTLPGRRSSQDVASQANYNSKTSQVASEPLQGKKEKERSMSTMAIREQQRKVLDGKRNNDAISNGNNCRTTTYQETLPMRTGMLRI